MKIKLFFFLICTSMVYAPGFGEGPIDDDFDDDHSSSEYDDDAVEYQRQLREEYLAKFHDENVMEPKTPISPVSSDTSVGYRTNFTDSTNSSDAWTAQTSSSVDDFVSDTTKKSVSLNFSNAVKENASVNMLEHFENNFMKFSSDADAVKAVKKYLDDGGNPNLKNKQGKSLISLLLDNLSSEKKEYQLKSNITIKQVLKLLVDNGAKPTSAEIDQALNKYKNFVEVDPNLKVDPKTFKIKSLGIADSFVSRFLTSDVQKSEMIKNKNNAAQLADVIFMLDDAASKNVVTPEQREKISNLEEQYKTTFQRVTASRKRTSKSLFSKN